MNTQSRRPYRGVNFALLSLEAQSRGYAINRWLTYRQESELGAQVRRGEHGTPVVFWQLRKLAAEPLHDEPDTSSLPDKVVPLLRAYTVFNVAQIDGLPSELTTVIQPKWEPEAKAEELLVMSDATVRHGGSKAFYAPATEEIQLPPRSAFPNASGYYNVALHELTTGPHIRRAVTGSWDSALAMPPMQPRS